MASYDETKLSAFGGGDGTSRQGQRPAGAGNRRRAKKSGNRTPPGFSSQKDGSSRKNHHGGGRRRSPVLKSNAPADMTVIVNHVDLWDIIKREDHSHHDNSNRHRRNHNIAPYYFAPDVSCWVTTEQAATKPDSLSVAVVRAHWSPQAGCQQTTFEEGAFNVIDTSIPNPYPPSICHDKYWCQRRRLFSRFDMGVQLDSEGWFSVTPEIIADHVAQCVGDLSNSSAFRRGKPGSDLREQDGIVVLDAFCGCGGNAIAFGKLPPDKISLVVCVDIDRSKLRKAAYNASLYDIPNHKLIFIECNTLFILGLCYKDGALALDKLGANDEYVPKMPSPVVTEIYAGYKIGGLDLLPPRIDAVFMDPPWGGVEYNQLKNGYDLERHMKIRVGPIRSLEPPTKAPEPAAAGGLGDDFFDSFGGSQPSKSMKAEFNEMPTDGEYVNGVDLVKMAAGATRSHLVVYDLPRNTNKTSLGQSALAAGYRGNLKLEEHYLNGRLKTVTAYMGADYCSLLNGS